MSTGRWNGRSLAVFAVGFSFVAMALSGLVEFIAPQGRLSRSIDWRFLGLSREAWEAIHIASALAFAGFAIWHIVIHWSVIRSFAIGSRERPATHRTEAIAMGLVVLIFVVTAVFDIPPASWLIALNHLFKTSVWGEAL